MRLYDLTKQILEHVPATRDSDKKLVWSVWMKLGYADNGMVSLSNFLEAPSSDSITRARRKIQELNPHLGPSDTVRTFRKDIEQQRGTYVFREGVAYKEDSLF